MKQSPEARKAKALADLAEARRSIIAEVELLPPSERDMAFLGVWSAHDVVAHLVGWDHTNGAAVAAVLEGRLPEFYAYYDADWRTYNAGLVKLYKQNTLSETIIAAEASSEALLAAVRAVPAADVVRDHGVRSPRGRRVTIEMLLLAEARDEQKHARQVREFAATLPAL